MVSGAFPLLSAVNGDTGTTTFAAKAITWQHFKGANTALLLYKNYKLIEMRYVTNLCKGGKALWLFIYRHKPLVFFSTFSPYSDKSFHPPTLVVYFIRSSSNLAHT